MPNISLSVYIAAAESSFNSWIFLYSDLRQKIEDNTTGFPLAELLVDHGPQVEYSIISNGTFPLSLQLLAQSLKKGCGESIWILASRFSVLQSTMKQEPAVVMRIVMTFVVLHNLF